MKKQIVIINGTGTCGKDTFVDFVKKYANVTNFSSIDKIKEITSLKFFLKIPGLEFLANYGYKYEKTEKDRKMLSQFKNAATEYNDFPFLETKNAVELFLKSDNEIMFIHIREPEEIKKAVSAFRAKTLLIKRDGLANIESNESDKNVDNYDYDYIIINSNFDSLEEQAKQFVNEIKEKPNNLIRKLTNKQMQYTRMN